MKPHLMSVVAILAAVVLAAACADEIDIAEGEQEGRAAAPANCAGGNAEGRSCNDGLFCTVEDRCRAGVCIGEERPCNDVVGFCAVATCNEASDRCEAAPREPGCVDRCDTTKLRKFYSKGWEKGFKAVSKDWDRRQQNCDLTDEFVDRITQRLEDEQRGSGPDDDRHAHRRCRKAGTLDGAYAALGGIQNLCDQVCFLDGELVGTIAATTYCEMAIDAGSPLDVADWVRGPINMCGLNYEVACDSTFIGESTGYRNGSCEQFTWGVAAWDATRNQSCDYRNRP